MKQQKFRRNQEEFNISVIATGGDMDIIKQQQREAKKMRKILDKKHMGHYR